MCVTQLSTLLLLLVQLALGQSGNSRYVKRYQTEFAVAIVIAIIFLVTSIFFLYKWISTYRSVPCNLDQTLMYFVLRFLELNTSVWLTLGQFLIL